MRNLDWMRRSPFLVCAIANAISATPAIGDPENCIPALEAETAYLQAVERANVAYGNALAAANTVRSNALAAVDAAERTLSGKAHDSFHKTKEALDARRSSEKHDARAAYSDKEHKARIRYSGADRSARDAYSKARDEAWAAHSRAQPSGGDASTAFNQIVNRAHDVYVRAEAEARTRLNREIETAQRVLSEALEGIDKNYWEAVAGAQTVPEMAIDAAKRIGRQASAEADAARDLAMERPKAARERAVTRCASCGRSGSPNSCRRRSHPGSRTPPCRRP